MRIFEFLQDEKRLFSSTRLVFLIWSIGILTSWMIVSIVRKELAEIPWNVTGIFLSLMTGKVIQKFGESVVEKPAGKVTPSDNAT